ncbi:MAG: acyltransferase family protein [Limisphaerales bacterium]
MNTDAAVATQGRVESAKTPQTTERYHALDALRATMMLLGIYLHVVVGYTGDGRWPYIDPHPTRGINVTLGVIHSFRMPAFYMMAGFFGALLWDRRGVAAFVSNRTKRVLVPFILFWSLLFPPIAVAVISLERGADQVIPFFTSGELLKRLHPLHLWFLEYLLLLYLIAAIAVYLSRHLPERAKRGIGSGYRWGLQRWYAPGLCAVFSWLPLTAMHGGLKDCDGLIPEPIILIAYVVPFGFGWLLYHNRDLLPCFERHIWLYVGLTVPAWLIWVASGKTHPFLRAAGNATLCWLWTFAWIGLFLKFLNQPRPLVRYLSDASYWLYIMHMPVVVGLQFALLPVPLPALAKIPIVLALAVAILIASYDLMVRPTWIGILLNGRRYPRHLPVLLAESVSLR